MKAHLFYLFYFSFVKYIYFLYYITKSIFLQYLSIFDFYYIFLHFREQMCCFLYENVVLLLKNFSTKAIVQEGLFYKQFMIEYVAYIQKLYKLQCLC